MSQIKTKGTKEWSDVSLNILNGCPHNCIYCYARRMDHRFNRDPDGCTLKTSMPRLPSNKRVMFPTTHDIAPEFMNEITDTIVKLIERNNSILIVTKAKADIISELINNLLEKLPIETLQEKIEFRITITWTRRCYYDFFEKGAGSYQERVQALEEIHHLGIPCSVSAEPLLGAPADLRDIIHSSKNAGAKNIWVGCLSFIPKEMKEYIWYSQKNLTEIYETWKEDEFVIFKDTFENRLNKFRCECGSLQTHQILIIDSKYRCQKCWNIEIKKTEDFMKQEWKKIENDECDPNFNNYMKCMGHYVTHNSLKNSQVKFLRKEMRKEVANNG